MSDLSDLEWWREISTNPRALELTEDVDRLTERLRIVHEIAEAPINEFETDQDRLRMIERLSR